MPDYQLPTISKPPKAKKNQVLLVANGDLRHSANRRCWPAQQAMEEQLRQAVDRGRLRARAGPSLQVGRGARVHRLAKRRDAGLCRHRPERQADRGRGRLAILAPRAARAALAPRADPHRGQLVGHLAGAGGHAQPQRLAHQGRQQILHALERGFHRQAVSAQPESLAGRRRGQAQNRSRRPLEATSASRRPRAPTGQAPGRATAPRKSHHGRVRRRLHGHVQRHHSRRTA